MLEVTVQLDLRKLKKFRNELDKGSSSPHILRVLKQWAARYRGFVQRRFDKFSKGGGNWPPLAESTKRGRRKGTNKKAKVDFAILRDTGTLFAALNPSFSNAPGAIEKPTSFGVIVGYGGPGRYASGGRATVADIASFHNAGVGRLPKRQIIVPPDAATTQGMISDMERALGKMARDE
jgi:hypothetical protein